MKVNRIRISACVKAWKNYKLNFRTWNWRHFLAAGTIKISFKEAQINPAICDFLNAFKASRPAASLRLGFGRHILRNLSIVTCDGLGEGRIALGRCAEFFKQDIHPADGYFSLLQGGWPSNTQAVVVLRNGSDAITAAEQTIGPVKLPADDGNIMMIRRPRFGHGWLSDIAFIDIEPLEAELVRRLPVALSTNAGARPKRYRVKFDERVIRKVFASHIGPWYNTKDGQVTVAFHTDSDGRTTHTKRFKGIDPV